MARSFTREVAEWLVDEAGPNPFQSPMPILLTFESGFACTTESQRIDPKHLLAVVDVILGLLDRMGATPAQPPTPGR